MQAQIFARVFAQRLAAIASAILTVVACSPSGPPAPTQNAPIASAAPVAPSPYQITCATFPERTTRSDLEQRFGKANIREENINIGEGKTKLGLILFPEDPARRLEIIFGEATKGLAQVRTAGPESLWKGAKGLRVGASFTDVEALNGRMFITTGFFSDFGGRVTNWGSDGAFTVQEDGCSILVAFEEPANAGAVPDNLVGDRVFSSQVAAARALNPKVREIGIGYPQP